MDKVAIVTGAGTGIGRGIALMFAKEGARVVICGRRIAPLEETLSLLIEVEKMLATLINKLKYVTT